MKVRELIQDLLLMDPDLEVVIPGGEMDDRYVSVHEWDYVYPTADIDAQPEAIVLWPV